MAPFRIAATNREVGAPPLLPHLADQVDRSNGGLMIDLEIRLLTSKMRCAGEEPIVISRPKFKDQYWTPFQMLAHQTSNGCKMETGDLLGSGTISGSTGDELGCLMEITLGGSKKIPLPNGEQRTYLENGDEVIISARSALPGYVSIGFGQCSGKVLPSA